MAGIKPYVLNALPGSFTASAMYFIKDATHADRFNLYLANSSGSAVRRLPTADDITAEIATAVSSTSSVDFAANIAARDAKVYAGNTMVYVQDASADVNVNSGAALYFYNKPANTYSRAAEFESMDLQITWAALQNKPTSAVADIDDAVTKRHTHTNSAALATISLDGSGYLVANGVTLDGAISLGATAEW